MKCSEWLLKTFSLTLITLLLVGCSTSSVSVAPTPTSVPPTATSTPVPATPTDTPKPPSNTPTPTNTLLPTDTLTPEDTPTPVPPTATSTPKAPSVAEHFERGRQYFEQEEYDKAIAEFQEVIKLDPEFGVAYAFLGYSYVFGPEELDKGIEALETYLNLEPNAEEKAQVEQDIQVLRALLASQEDTELYDEQADAAQEIDLALAQAKAENKYVLLDFGADWCPDCHALAYIFEDNQVKPFIDENYIIVHINVGYWDANLDISERYGDPIAQGIPAVVILDSDEQIITSTQDGELANARTATKQEILDFLQTWAPQR